MPRRSLLRLLGVAFGVAVMIGNTMGVGIIRRPGVVADQLGNGWQILGMWIFGGLFAVGGSLVVAELSTMTPLAGGFYVLARRAMGPRAAFSVGWCDWLGNTAAVAYAALTFGELIRPVAPAIAPAAWAAAAIVLFAAVQSLGLRSSAIIQQLTSFAVCLAFVAFIVCGLAGGLPGQFSSSVQSPGRWSAAALVLAFQSVVVTYDGWYAPIYFAEEDRRPSTDLPRSMLAGALLVASIYVMMNVTLLNILPFAEMRTSGAPVAAAAGRVFGGRGAMIAAVLSLLSVTPLVSAAMLSATRVMFGLGRDGLFASWAAFVSDRGAPLASLWATAAGALLLLFTGAFDRLLAMAGFFYVAMYCSSFVSLFVLRRREPAADRPFRVPLYPATPGFVLAAGLLYLAGAAVQDAVNSALAIALLAISLPVYSIVQRRPGTVAS